MRREIIFGILVSVIGAFALPGCDGGESGGGGTGGADELLLGGDTTVFDASSKAFTFPAAGLTDEGLIKHEEGDGAFEAIFVTSPSPVNPGLGPVFNNNSCQSCHANNGRGKPDDTLTSLLFRVSVPGESEVGGPNPVAGFGLQLQTRATIGTAKEAGVNIEYTETPGQYGDGTEYSLRIPVYNPADPYIPPPVGMLLSPRIAPPIFGIGLLEAIPEDEILANADPADEDGDGISGRPNMVWNLETGQTALGRFGWKANTPTAFQQAAEAYNQDMGITNPLVPDESCLGQTQCDGIDDDPEIPFDTLDDAAFYVQTLAVPARREFDTESRRGEKLFEQAGCSSCHIPVHTTDVHPARNESALNNQVIFPYTDLLLHDMGDGLADRRPDFLANGREWRTSPLWGIGLTKTTNGHTNFLHDGRARNLEEAILWHDGEGKESRDFFRNLKKSDRDALIAFLKNL
ncbi:MAG: hypothetical protein A3J42_03020 [Candidatus Dadabacteria bacterium RIFCSPHIGHO2_12_FULL_53_21]|nr:MAG: hypothetical protein A3J42_03020 [Candidatus Dadabacteria bacterium RIFCSPHIGHO2_12_FULL_53_21]